MLTPLPAATPMKPGSAVSISVALAGRAPHPSSLQSLNAWAHIHVSLLSGLHGRRSPSWCGPCHHERVGGRAGRRSRRLLGKEGLIFLTLPLSVPYELQDVLGSVCTSLLTLDPLGGRSSL